MISVAIATYNGAKFIRPQVLSILGQSLPPDEIIICDDRSTDETVSIIRELMAQDPRIHLHINSHTLGK